MMSLLYLVDFKVIKIGSSKLYINICSIFI